VVSLSPTFTYTYGTYLGGNGAEDGTQWPGIAIDGEDRAYVVSSTTSSNYPVLSAIQATKAGGRDATISCLDEQGTLTWSTYFGGSADDEFTSITHHNGLLFLGGSTMSGSISHITTSTAFQASSGGSGDGMFAVMRTDGTVANASFYGGNGNDKIHDIDIRNGHLTFAGPAVGTNFPVFNATQSSSGGGTDGQLVLFDTDAFSAIIVNDVDASDCDANDGEITIELSSGELGTPPYDVSINNGFSFESSRSNLTANSTNQLSLTNIPWGTYVIKVRDAMGRQSRAGALQIKGCILLMCMESGENRLQLPEVVGATSYLWTTTAGTIDSGQGTRTIYINTTSMNTGDFGEVCVQAQGAGCDAPIVCVDIQKMCSREYCNNGVDDDGDNLVDCADEECPGANAAVRITQN